MTRRLMRDSRALAAIAPAWPGTTTVTVSKKDSVATSKPRRLSPSAMIRVIRWTLLAIFLSPSGP